MMEEVKLPPPIFRLSVIQCHMEKLALEFDVAVEAYRGEIDVPSDEMKTKYMAGVACTSIINAMETLGAILENGPDA